MFIVFFPFPIFTLKLGMIVKTALRSCSSHGISQKSSSRSLSNDVLGEAQRRPDCVADPFGIVPRIGAANRPRKEERTNRENTTKKRESPKKAKDKSGPSPGQEAPFQTPLFGGP